MTLSAFIRADCQGTPAQPDAEENRMDTNWEKLERDLADLKASISAIRNSACDLSVVDIERLLIPVRGCIVELIALRSSLEKIKGDRAADHGAR
jgi:hypothetical protein